jgi:GNAT superfamily N-acetyltransferase
MSFLLGVSGVQFAVLDWHEARNNGRTDTATGARGNDERAADGAGEDGNVRLRLDHRQFAYAGKFVRSDAGIAVAVADDVALASVATDGTDYADVLGAVVFDEDRTDPAVLRIRYVTVRQDRRGEGIGSRLLAAVATAGHGRGYGVVRIAVNNVFAYEASYRAGFGWTGRETGIAELVCDRPDPTARDRDRYRAGLSLLGDRAGGDPAASFVASHLEEGPPPVVDAPALS